VFYYPIVLITSQDVTASQNNGNCLKCLRASCRWQFWLHKAPL